MAENSFTEVTRQSWGSRIGNSIKGIVFGLILFIVSFPLLFWNEGRAVRTYKTLKEGGSAVVTVAAVRVDEANAGKLVHMTGKAVTPEILADPVFAVSANALKLRRNVELFQWRESSQSSTQKKVGGATETTTTYTYDKVWTDRRVRSSEFKQPQGHENPASTAPESEHWMADAVTLGAFRLPPALVSQIDVFTSLPVADGTPAPPSFQGRSVAYNMGFYIGTNPASPQIGDARVSFQAVLPTDVSIIAKQVGDTFESYTAKAGGTIEMLVAGTVSAEEMIHHALQSNTMLTWILRVAGFFLMFIGFSMTLGPLVVLADVLPILGTIVGAGTGMVAFLISGVLSLVTVAIAWFVYRPVFGVILLAAAIGLIFVIKGKLKKAKPAA